MGFLCGGERWNLIVLLKAMKGFDKLNKEKQLHIEDAVTSEHRHTITGERARGGKKLIFLRVLWFGILPARMDEANLIIYCKGN